MGKMVIKNLYGADIELEGVCSICNKPFIYRIKERKICPDDKCYQESKRRYEKDNSRRRP